jgi:hypothetical protein
MSSAFMDSPAHIHAQERLANGPRRGKVEGKMRTLTFAFLFMLAIIIVAAVMAWLLVTMEAPRSTLSQKRVLIPLVALVFATTGAVGLVLGRVFIQQSCQRVGGMNMQRAIDILYPAYISTHWARAVLLIVPSLFATVATMITGELSLLLVPAGCAWIMAWLVPTYARFEKFAQMCTKST